MYFNKTDLEKSDRIKRLNLINAVTGIKPANLIGTISGSGQTNLAVFSSVVHLGSNPALIGFISRPDDEVPRHTMSNIKDTGVYTINHIHPAFIERAHFTSAKFEKDQSEFDKCGLSEAYLNDFKTPFVEESRLKIGMKYLESIPIKANGTILVVGEIEHLILPEEVMDTQGHVDLELLDSVGISGLNSYYKLEKIATMPYARVEHVPEFEK